MKTKNRVIDLLRLLPLGLILILAAPVDTTGQAGKVNFTGNWILNSGKSTLGDNPRMAGGDFIAKQDGNILTVESTRPNRDGGTVTTTSKYTLDGKESVNTSPRGNSKSVAAWSSDGKTLTITTSRSFDRNGESVTMKSTETWTQTNPNTIIIQATTSTSGGSRTLTMVYDKK